MNNDEKFSKLLGQWMREKREKAGFNQEEIGHMLGVSKPMISYYESGQSAISAKAFVRFCKIVNANPNDIINML